MGSEGHTVLLGGEGEVGRQREGLKLRISVLVRISWVVRFEWNGQLPVAQVESLRGEVCLGIGGWFSAGISGWDNALCVPCRGVGRRIGHEGANAGIAFCGRYVAAVALRAVYASAGFGRRFSSIRDAFTATAHARPSVGRHGPVDWKTWAVIVDLFARRERAQNGGQATG
jgi:hypothetical protein